MVAPSVLATLLTALAAAPLPASPAGAAPGGSGGHGARSCPPSATALGYSDALDKLVRDGATLGGLSDLARDRRSHGYVSTVDNHDTDPARLWFVRDLAHPRVTRDPLVLRRPGGVPFTGEDADFEGLAVLPDGHFVVSSEREPSIRVFGRGGRQLGRLRVPRRLHVAPTGEATANATLEGLTLAPGGRRLVASMEGTLSGDVAGDGSASAGTYRRFLVYERGRGDRFRLVKQVGYQVQPGNRVAEVQAYAAGRLLVLEAAYDPTTGNSIELYATRGFGKAPDVSRVANLSAAPRRDLLPKRLVADVTACPTLGATSEEPQTNPLMDNYEGMAVRGRRVTLISDDNFSDTQRTRVLRLRADLP